MQLLKKQAQTVRADVLTLRAAKEEAPAAPQMASSGFTSWSNT